MRLFAALLLSPVAVERLTSHRLRLSSPKDGLRWSAPEQWHITLQFYGEVDQQTLECLLQALTGVQAPSPELLLDGFGLFAAKGILYASLEPSPSLLQLQREVSRASESCGLVAESRPFRPHITLARSRGKSGNQSLRRMSQAGLPAFGSEIRWHASEFLLIESRLSPSGASYTERARFALRSALTS